MLTQFELGQKRARKHLRRKRIIEARLRAYGEKSLPVGSSWYGRGGFESVIQAQNELNKEANQKLNQAWAQAHIQSRKISWWDKIKKWLHL